MSDAAFAGRFVWYELMTTDPAGAQAFYSAVAGWGTQAFDVGGTDYTLWTVGDRPVGGVMQLPAEAAAGGAPPHWLAYISVLDVDAAAAEAGRLGAATLVPAQDIPGTGRFAVLRDPQGAVFCVYRGQDPMPETVPEPEPGDFSWHELATTDLDASFTFYSALFGWEKHDDFDMGEIGIYRIFGQHRRDYGGMFRQPAEMPGPPAWALYIHVDDAHAAAERVGRAGGRIVNGPMDVPGGDRIVQCLDPQGAFICLHSRGAAQG